MYFKYFKELGDYAREHQNKLQIYYLRVDDTGDYECFLPDGRRSQVRLTVIKNLNEIVRPTSEENQFLESSVNQRGRIDEERAPQTQVEYEPYIEKEAGQSVSISCGLAGDDENELKWKKLEPVRTFFRNLLNLIYKIHNRNPPPAL